jgi:hypothetical protein
MLQDSLSAQERLFNLVMVDGRPISSSFSYNTSFDAVREVGWAEQAIALQASNYGACPDAILRIICDNGDDSCSVSYKVEQLEQCSDSPVTATDNGGASSSGTAAANLGSSSGGMWSGVSGLTVNTSTTETCPADGCELLRVMQDTSDTTYYQRDTSKSVVTISATVREPKGVESVAA